MECMQRIIMRNFHGMRQGHSNTDNFVLILVRHRPCLILAEAISQCESFTYLLIFPFPRLHQTEKNQSYSPTIAEERYSSLLCHILQTPLLEIVINSLFGRILWLA